MEAIVGMVILVLDLFDFGFKTSWITLLVYPLGLLPFTYATQFAFSTVALAQTVTLFFHFSTMMLFGMTSYFLRIYEQTEMLGDRLN